MNSYCTILLSFLLFWIQTASAQSYFSFDAELPLEADGSIMIHPENPLRMEVDQSNVITLTPPDMGKISPSRIMSFDSDTLRRSGPDEIVMSILLDTLFLTESIYLTSVPVEVRAYEDRTFEGKSTLGYLVLNQIGQVSGPGRSAQTGHPSLLVRNLDPSMIPDHQKFDFYAGNLVPFSTSFPFTQGDLVEIRLISCNNLDDTFYYLEELEFLFQQNSIYCDQVTIDPTIPPTAAVSRLPSRITVRYFEAVHQERAEALTDLISGLFDMPVSAVQIEDMLPFYGGNTPVNDYIEIWLN